MIYVVGDKGWGLKKTIIFESTHGERVDYRVPPPRVERVE